MRSKNKTTQKTNDTHNPFKQFSCWVSGSIRRKLTFFVILVCSLMTCLVWSLAIMLIEPAYDAALRKDLSSRLEAVAGVFDKAYAEGVPISVLVKDFPTPKEQLSEEIISRLQTELDAGRLNLDNFCLDISSVTTGLVDCIENLPSVCVLHPRVNVFTLDLVKNSETAVNLRNEVFAAGGAYVLRYAPAQMILGRTAANGNYSIIASVSIESINQSVKVLLKLMLPISLSIIAVSILAASVFSHWFTKPISHLSHATREMAKGNYDVSVNVAGNDEITCLADDFNTMAAEVKRSAELQRDLIANVSHDLRTPLTLIKGYAETIRDLSGDDPQKRNEQLQVIMDETDRLSSLVGSVMEMTRISSGHEMNERVLFNLTQLCEEVAYRYNLICQKQGYHFDFYAEEYMNIVADPELIERALHNFLGNGLNHIGADGYLALRVLKTAKGNARVEVVDHGEGVDSEDLPYLFDKYYRSRKDTGKAGTGLGLSIAKAIFVAHGFDYGIISTPGAGSTFWFEAQISN